MKTIEEITEDPFVDAPVQYIQAHQAHTSPVPKSEPQLSSDKNSVASKITLLEKETQRNKLERIGEENNMSKEDNDPVYKEKGICEAFNITTEKIEKEIQEDAIGDDKNISKVTNNNCLDVRILKTEGTSISNKLNREKVGNEAFLHEEKDTTSHSEKETNQLRETKNL
eukprot:TRINITY_DN824_c0_g1_i10.p1 TRINITY_DN824_c0_g1~~TRINITY_DN824_c0_g1_i10.p1  ORF type:complete len:169 (-),score=35.83 TRINITY_DN824_c0_g1_i10:112-618(-)